MDVGSARMFEQINAMLMKILAAIERIEAQGEKKGGNN